MPEETVNADNLSGVRKLLKLWGQGTLRIPSLPRLPTSPLPHALTMLGVGGGADLLATHLLSGSVEMKRKPVNGGLNTIRRVRTNRRPTGCPRFGDHL
jgi:hypothetical protein